MSWYKKAETLLIHLNREDNSSLKDVFAFGLNWYKRGLIKTAGYDYTDVLGNQISSMMSHLQPLVGKVVGADKSIAALKTRLNVWNKAQQSRDEVAMREARAAAFIALRKAQETINSQGNAQTAQNPVMRDVQQTLTTAPDWQAFGKSGDISQKVTLVPGQQFNGGKPGPNTWVKIGIKLHPEQYYDKKPGYTKNPAGEVVEQTMGDWCRVGIPPRDPNIYIRGTQEAWNKFLGVSGWVFANDATIKAFKFPQPLPSEKQFDPSFAEQQEEKPKGMKPLEVKQVPPSGKNAKAKGGLQLIFDVRNPSFRPDFPQIRDYIYQVDQKKQSSVFSPGTVEIDWTNGVIVIPDLVPKDDVMSLAIMQLKNKLQQLGYANTAGIGNIVTTLTGIKPKEAYNETRNEMLAQPRTHVKTQGAIKANLKPQGPKLASRFHGFAQELGIDPTQPMSPEQYEQVLSRAYVGKPAPEQLDPQTGKPIPSGIPYGPDNWHGPFGSKTTPHQRKAQAEGMRFVASRTASVLADEPGSGKCNSNKELCEINGILMSMESIWNKHFTSVRYDDDNGEWSTPNQSLTVNSIDCNGNIVLGNVTYLYREKFVGKLRKIVTNNGKSITTSFPHKFLSDTGWTNDVKVGTKICSSISTLPLFNDAMDKKLVEFLAWQIGEGYENRNGHRLIITQKDTSVLDRLKAIFDDFGFDSIKGTPVCSTIAKNNKGYTFLRISSKDFVQYLEKFGYEFGNRSAQKSIPDFIMQSNEDVLKIFLRAFFDAEGYADKNKRCIGLTSASKKLIMQIGTLLSRFGILHTFHNKTKYATNTVKKTKRQYYELSIIGTGIDIFMKEIGFGYAYKNEAIANQISDRNTNKEGKPVDKILNPLIEKYGIPYRHLGISNQKYLDGTRGANNEKIDKIISCLERIGSGQQLQEYKEKIGNKWTKGTIAVYESIDLEDIRLAIEQLHILRNNDLIYETVISVEEIDYDGYIYDLTVDKYHNYVAEGLICHNTAQAIVGADAVREDGQKVLVVTPGVLLQENWVGDDAKGPMFFCGHDRNQVAVISNSQDYEAAMADPSKVWIVLRDTTLQQTGGDMQKLVQGISGASKQKKFSSLIIDEIQRYKNSDSIRFEQMQNAISPYDIDHRIGLTGTPADNTPDDIFSQMALLRHGQLYTNDGKRNWTQVQGVVGFSRQFLGGEELSTGVQLTDDEKKKSPEEQEQIIATKWAHKASGVLQWVQQLDKNKKEDILDLFTSTYLRRNKEDIRPEIAQEAPLDNTGKIEVPADPQIPFRRDIKTLEKIANKKAEATAEHAKALLLANPQQKIFIASRFISSANLIAKLINEKMGTKGIAVAVTSKFAAPLMHPSDQDGRVGPKMNDEEARAHVAEEFRKDNGRLNHHDDVLRAVVYTLDLGAVGLNFSNATEAIINDMAWNPSTNLQAEYRVHRIDSRKPVKINYTMMKGTYDEEMYKRVNKKKEINKGMSDLMRAAQQEKDPKARLALANKFVDDAIENILIDAGLSPKQQRWFDENLQKAFHGQPVETFEQMIGREKQLENQLLFDNMPQWTHLPTSMGIVDQYKASALETLEDHFGEEWTRLPPEVLKPFLHQVFARQEQVAA